VSEWINVKTHLPTDKYEPSIKVKAKINNNDDFVLECNFRMMATELPGYSLRPHWFSDTTEDGIIRLYYGITHWMPLPQPPHD
jgi:hypothetical protein